MIDAIKNFKGYVGFLWTFNTPISLLVDLAGNIILSIPFYMVYASNGKSK